MPDTINAVSDPLQPDESPNETSTPEPAVPEWGAESREERIARLHGDARALPLAPGVYLMKNKNGVVLYVGKASKLRDRVGSYFIASTDLGPRKNKLLDEVHTFETFETDTPWEALLAENRLIKDIKPKYNAAQRDDKTYPYLVVTMGEDYPRVFISRNPTGVQPDGSKDPRFNGANVLGPFTSPGALREAIDALQSVFKFRTCSLDIIEGDPKNKAFRPCLLASIGKCTAPCNESIASGPYRDDINRFVRFLKTKRTTMIRELTVEMEQASKDLQFERAATLRDQVRAIKRIDHRATTSDRWQPETEIGYIEPEKGPKALARALGVTSRLRCLEGFDIAHLQGGETVASKVCFVDGRPFKQEYRRYRIKSFENLEGGRRNDDFASMREVISRRYRDAGAGHELYPDLILIDGGKGQLSAAMDAFAQLDIKPPLVISIAKKEELLYTTTSPDPIRLGRNNPGLRLCQQIRDEAHRFAQHYHHILRRKATLGD